MLSILSSVKFKYSKFYRKHKPLIRIKYDKNKKLNIFYYQSSNLIA